MRLLISLLMFASVVFSQKTAEQIGNLKKADFEKWMKPLVLDGHKFSGFEHEFDSFHAVFLKGMDPIQVVVRFDDGLFKEAQLKKMGYQVFEVNKIKHFLNANDFQTIDNVILPKYKVFFSVGADGKKSKEYMNKLFDEIKIYEK